MNVALVHYWFSYHERFTTNLPEVDMPRAHTSFFSMFFIVEFNPIVLDPKQGVPMLTALDIPKFTYIGALN